MFTLEDGYMQCNIKPSGPPGYPNVPAKYDDGGNNFSFADGHVEYRKWTYKTSNPGEGILNCPYVYGSRGPGSGNSAGASGLDQDWQWLRHKISVPLPGKNPPVGDLIPLLIPPIVPKAPGRAYGQVVCQERLSLFFAGVWPAKSKHTTLAQSTGARTFLSART